MPSRRPAISWLIDKEWRELLLSRAWWILLLCMGPLVGVSFISAVQTYAEASGLGGTAAGVGEAFSPSDRSKPFMLDRSAWHELKCTISGADFKAWIDGSLALEYTLGSDPVGGRGTPNPDLLPANNPVLRPPVSGNVGLWAKTDSTSYFKDFTVSPQP